MADISAQPGDHPNSIRSQYIAAMRQVKDHLKAGRVDEQLRAFATHEEAARIASEHRTRYAEILAEVRAENHANGL